MTTSTDPHEWADSLAEWAVLHPSPMPRIPRHPEPPPPNPEPSQGASACSGIEEEQGYTPRLVTPHRPNYTWAVVVLLCLACAARWVFGG